MQWTNKEETIVKKWLNKHEKDSAYDRKEIIKLLPNRNWNQIDHRIRSWGLRTPPAYNGKPIDIQSITNEFQEKKESTVVKGQLKEAIKEIVILKKNNEAIVDLQKNYSVYNIKPTKAGIKDAVVILQASDWHLDEVITMAQTNGLNEFNLEIAKQRVNNLAISAVKVINDNWGKVFNIREIVIQLGGDFIGGNIHEELMESNSIDVMSAMIEAQSMIASMLHYIQEHVNVKITCVCNVGNHCVSEDTEILTNNGFVLAKDITKKNIVASFQKENGKIEYSKPKAIEKFSQNGGIEIKSTHKNELVTPDHNLVIKGKFVKANKFDIGDRGDFRYSGNTHNKKQPYTDDELKLITWVVTDGTLVDSSKYAKYSDKSIKKRVQFKLSKQRKIESLTSLLDGMNIKYTIHKATLSLSNILQPFLIRIYGDEARQIFKLLNNKKQFPKDFSKLNKKQILTVINTIGETDGTFRKKHIEWSSVEKANIDIIQIACITNNINFSFQDKPLISGFKGREMIYVAYIYPNGFKELRNQKVRSKFIDKSLNYVGIQTNNGTLITRRDGKIGFTGNSRITKKPRISTEAGNNLETYMYANLQKHNQSINFIINDSYHKYLDILGFKCRFHHGHAIRYGGGIGGIFIPANKKISQWNKAKTVDYDFFCHFHQCKDGGNFMCNGSLVGYNSFAIKIGADFETPKQMISLITENRGIITSWKLNV